MGAVAFADDDTTIIETVKVSASDDNPTNEQTVTADVSVNDADAVIVKADSDEKQASATLDLTGDVTATGDAHDGVRSESETQNGNASSNVTVNGDISASGDDSYGVFCIAETDPEAEDSAKGNSSSIVTITGDVKSNDDTGVAVYAITDDNADSSASSRTRIEENADGTGGNVTGATGIDIWASGSGVSVASVSVDGNVTGTDGGGVEALCGDGNSYLVVFVSGDVTGSEDGVAAITGNTDQMSGISMTILGDVTGENGIETMGANIAIRAWGTVEGTDAALVVHGSDIPTISVTKLEVAEGGELIKADTPELTEAVAKSIQYIINADKEVNVSGDDVLYGIFTHEDSVLSLKLADGYELSGSGEYADVTNNGDGTYTVKVNRGGDLVFTATLKYIAPAAEPETYVESFLSGNTTDAEQPAMTVNMKVSHLQKVLFNGEELDASEYVVAMESHGLLTFRFAEDFIKNLEAGTYRLVFQGSDGTVSFRLIVNTDGSYKIVY